jgi:hypothetical protein
MRYEDMTIAIDALGRLHESTRVLVTEVEPRLAALRSNAPTVARQVDHIRYLINRLDTEERVLAHTTQQMRGLGEAVERARQDRNDSP